MKGLLSTLAAAATLVAGSAFADNTKEYEVTITNLTKGQSFTPQLVVAHDETVVLFEPGTAASPALESLAESGSTAGLTDDLLAHGYGVNDVHTIGGLIGPGQSATTTLEASPQHRHLSVAAMLIPTNDTFVALRGGALPKKGSATYYAVAYDAGTEQNDQNCLNIPGPVCNGMAGSPAADTDEGFIHVSNGMHELPEAELGRVLSPWQYDWRNPVAQIVVRALR